MAESIVIFPKKIPLGQIAKDHIISLLGGERMAVSRIPVIAVQMPRQNSPKRIYFLFQHFCTAYYFVFISRHSLSWHAGPGITKGLHFKDQLIDFNFFFLLISNYNFFPSPKLHRVLFDLCHISVRFVFQTIALLNIYRNPQNSAQSADGLHCKLSPFIFRTLRHRLHLITVRRHLYFVQKTWHFQLKFTKMFL